MHAHTHTHTDREMCVCVCFFHVHWHTHTCGHIFSNMFSFWYANWPIQSPLAGLQPQNECKFMCFDRNGACSNMGRMAFEQAASLLPTVSLWGSGAVKRREGETAIYFIDTFPFFAGLMSKKYMFCQVGFLRLPPTWPVFIGDRSISGGSPGPTSSQGLFPNCAPNNHHDANFKKILAHLQTVDANTNVVCIWHNIYIISIISTIIIIIIIIVIYLFIYLYLYVLLVYVYTTVYASDLGSLTLTWGCNHQKKPSKGDVH